MSTHCLCNIVWTESKPHPQITAAAWRIEYCYLHDAAGDLLAACEALLVLHTDNTTPGSEAVLEQAALAIVKAKGRA